jgi:outer membrane protein OmpA-like peptidoglycan-associated protein
MRMMTVASLLAALLGTAAGAAEVPLAAVLFPEQREVTVGFAATARAPRARLEAAVTLRAGQGRIELTFDDMKPAILFGGDVTSYLVWAVGREGKTVNLGELPVREARGTALFATGLKEFALLITAETHPLVDLPSELVMFSSLPVKESTARNTPFTFTGLAPSPVTANPSIAAIELSPGVSADLQQATRIVELARAADAETYAPQLIAEAEIALAQAGNLAQAGGRKKELIDFAQRAVSLGSQALRTVERRREAEELERRIAARQAEMAALESRAGTAERARLQAEASLLETETRKASLELELQRLAAERAALERQRQELSRRLEGALSQVASTRSTARGFIVDLPDILFDSGKATLKTEAAVTIAKLTGILLLMPELNLRIEGHTDSTGSAEFNIQLSRQRAEAVRDFIAEQGVTPARMVAAGYGPARPVADNATGEGRARNRRVEIVVAEGVVPEAQP